MKKEGSIDYKSIVVITAGFAGLSLLFANQWLLYIAIFVGFGSAMSNQFSQLILLLWSKIAHVLGWINTRILLTIVFYVFLFPIAIISRLVNKDPLKLKKASGSSLYTTRNHVYTAKDLEHPW